MRGEVSVMTLINSAVAWFAFAAVLSFLLSFKKSLSGFIAGIGGALGRTMSPVAGGLIICAGLAGTSPMEVAKRNAPGMILACIAVLVLLLYK